MFSRMIKAVLDTNVFISALFWTGSPHNVLAKALESEFILITSREILKEIEERLLNKFKFKFDSSASVFSGPVLPYSFADIKIAPVSSDPKPKIKWKSFLPFISYDMFHLKFICESSKEDFWQSIKRVFNYQKENGIKYHLIIFMHSWEFGDPSINNASLKYCSSKNWELLNEKLDFLNSKFKLNYKTINEFSA